jgi:putative NADH-flavin reductase
MKITLYGASGMIGRVSLAEDFAIAIVDEAERGAALNHRISDAYS